MPRFFAVILLAIAMSLTVDAQQGAREVQLSDAPLSADEIAVYRAVIEDYRSKFGSAVLRVADHTYALKPSGPFEEECRKLFRYVRYEAGEGQTPAIHRLSPEVTVGTSVALVDPDRQERKIRERDPQDLVRRAIDGHEQINPQQIRESVDKALESEMLTLSEIIFDRRHRRALVSYELHCGTLCGHGDTIVLKRAGRGWKVGKRCGGWVS